jgi:hypothetical protein
VFYLYVVVVRHPKPALFTCAKETIDNRLRMLRCHCSEPGSYHAGTAGWLLEVWSRLGDIECRARAVLKGERV